VDEVFKYYQKKCAKFVFCAKTESCTKIVTAIFCAFKTPDKFSQVLRPRNWFRSVDTQSGTQGSTTAKSKQHRYRGHETLCLISFDQTFVKGLRDNPPQRTQQVL
jgi:hypothetical protein